MGNLTICRDWEARRTVYVRSEPRRVRLNCDMGESSSLVPRTRSSHHNCRESGCELRVQSGTRIIDLLVSFDSEVRVGRAARFGELRNRDTSAANPKFAPQLPRVRLRTSGSKRH